MIQRQYFLTDLNVRLPLQMLQNTQDTKVELVADIMTVEITTTTETDGTMTDMMTDTMMTEDTETMMMTDTDMTDTMIIDTEIEILESERILAESM